MSGGHRLSRDAITKWRDLGTVPINTTVARSVPLPVFVRAPLPDPFAYIPAIVAKASASRTLEYMFQLDSHSKVIDGHVRSVYPMRSVARGLLDESLRLTNVKEARGEQIAELAGQMSAEIYSSLGAMKTNSTNAVQAICQLFTDYPFWDAGRAGDALLDAVAVLVARLITLDNLLATRDAVSGDLSILGLLQAGTQAAAADMERRLWAANPFAIRGELLRVLSRVDYPHVALICAAFWARAQGLKSDSPSAFILPELDTAYIVTFLMTLDFYAQAQKREAQEGTKRKLLKDLDPHVKQLAAQVLREHTSVLLYFEFGVDIGELLTDKSLMLEKPERAKEEFPLREIFHQVSQLVDNQSVLWAPFSHEAETPSTEKVANMIGVLPGTFRTLGFAIHTLRRFIISKHDHATETETQSNFEVAMRHDLHDDEKDLLMQILVSVRSVRELILSHIPSFVHAVSGHIFQAVQEFIQRLGSVKSKVDVLLSDIEKLRAMLGYFGKGDEKGQKTSKKGQVHPSMIAPPHLAMIELLRAQVQAFVRGPKKLEASDQRDFELFLEGSRYWKDLLLIDETLSIVCDQSGLFFKESLLDLYRKKMKKSVYFPVMASVPYVLIDYALQRTDKQELLAALFYPLSIYDDAAAVALKVLKSRFLYDEIVSEAKICTRKITQQISINVFNAVRRFVTARFRDQFDPNVIKPVPGVFDRAAALRIVSTLQQNQLFLLGRSIDTKIGSANHLNRLFDTAIAEGFKAVERRGLLAIILFTKTLEILQECHSVFEEAGIALIPFDDLVASQLRTTTPTSFGSHLLTVAIGDVQWDGDLIRHYLLHTNPYRLVPLKPPDMKLNEFQQPFQATLAFIGVEHFRALCGLLDDGAVHVLSEALCDTMSKVFEEFYKEYASVSPKIRRIPNSIRLGSGFVKTYEQFEGAYQHFVDSGEVEVIFKMLRALGTLVATSEMLDIALSLKRSCAHQIIAYLYMTNHTRVDENQREQLFGLFDAEFRTLAPLLRGIGVMPSPDEIGPPFLQKLVLRLKTDIDAAPKQILKEESRDLVFNFERMTGFAAVWSVLEFVFCLRQVHGKDPGDANVTVRTTQVKSFAIFGEGTLIGAALLLCLSGQQTLAKVVSIGQRINNQYRTDMMPSDKGDMKTFNEVFDLVKSSFNYAVSLVLPAVQAAKSQHD
jgi:hypothetical protein